MRNDEIPMVCCTVAPLSVSRRIVCVSIRGVIGRQQQLGASDTLVNSSVGVGTVVGSLVRGGKLERRRSMTAADLFAFLSYWSNQKNLVLLYSLCVPRRRVALLSQR